MPKPPEGARAEARKGLEWRKEFNRGGTDVGVARARDISSGADLSMDTIGRMVSYFARHEVDKKGQGWSPGEEGFPSAGRIAWALWGGDPGRRWAESVWNREKKNAMRYVKFEGITIEIEAPEPETEEESGDSEEMACKPRRFRMTAYTGQPVNSYGEKMIVDLAGMKIPQKAPILINHDANQIAGLMTAYRADSGALELEGEIYPDEEAGAKALRLSSKGFPWQASMGFRVEEMSFLEKDSNAEINGRLIQGPMLVARSSSLMESSFVPLGRDPNTTAEAFSAVVNESEEVMADTKAASLSELKGQFGTRPEFVLSQLEQNATMDQAELAWARLEAAEAKAEAEKVKADAERMKAEAIAEREKTERLSARGHQGVSLVPAAPQGDISQMTFSDAEAALKAEWDELGRANGRSRDVWFAGGFDAYKALRNAESNGLVGISRGIEKK